MTVKELLRALKNMDPDAEVVLAANYGDRACTMQALDIESVEEGTLVTSGYSDSGWAVADSDRDIDEDEDTRTAVVLS